MHNPHPPVLAICGDIALSTTDFLRSLQHRGQLLPLLRQAMQEHLLLHTAHHAGLTVTSVEVQDAANRFRASHGLTSAESTRDWLAERGLTLHDFTEQVRDDLLVRKAIDHLTNPHRDARFTAQPERYRRVRLSQLVVASMGQAQELHAQLYEDHQTFADLAHRYSLDVPSARNGGDLGVVFRCQVPDTMAEAVFAARPGEVVGPFQGNQGAYLFQVGPQFPPEPTEPTLDLIRQEILRDWLTHTMAEVRFCLAREDASHGTS